MTHLLIQFGGDCNKILPQVAEQWIHTIIECFAESTRLNSGKEHKREIERLFCLYTRSHALIEEKIDLAHSMNELLRDSTMKVQFSQFAPAKKFKKKSRKIRAEAVCGICKFVNVSSLEDRFIELKVICEFVESFVESIEASPVAIRAVSGMICHLQNFRPEIKKMRQWNSFCSKYMENHTLPILKIGKFDTVLQFKQ